VSASEKLKALAPRRAEAIITGSPEFKAYWNALPQIVAVVEAAEEFRNRLDCPGYIRDALTALDEALS
jgi:hypothetical protein